MGFWLFLCILIERNVSFCFVGAWQWGHNTDTVEILCSNSATSASAYLFMRQSQVRQLVPPLNLLARRLLFISYKSSRSQYLMFTQGKHPQMMPFVGLTLNNQPLKTQDLRTKSYVFLLFLKVNIRWLTLESVVSDVVWDFHSLGSVS